MDITKILLKIREGAEWSLTNNDYKYLVWRDKKQSKPTLAEIEAAWPSVQADIATEKAEKQNQAANMEKEINSIATLDDVKKVLLKYLIAKKGGIF